MTVSTQRKACISTVLYVMKLITGYYTIMIYGVV